MHFMENLKIQRPYSFLKKDIQEPFLIGLMA